MEGMLMLPGIILVTVVLTCMLDGKQRKRMAALLFCATMMGAYIPAGCAEEAEVVSVPVAVSAPVAADARVVVSSTEADPVNRLTPANEQVLENGLKTAKIGAVTYNTSGETYEIDSTSARVRVKNGDTLSFEGMIYAPEGETLSWIRVDVYDANPEVVPYTVGAEYYRVDGLKAGQFDLSSIPEMTIGDPFGWMDYSLAEGGKYIFMICAGDSNGNGFVDTDAGIAEDQGPAILVDVKLNPENCNHPHSNFVYIRHSSGEYRKHSYGDALTHQVEPLYERYCGLCDIFLMNIWGAGTAEEHILDANGTCMECGSYDDAAVEIAEDAIIGEEITDEEISGEEMIQDAAEALRKLFEGVVAATNPARSVRVVTSWENEVLAVGDTLTLTAELTGYEGLDYTIFWQCDMGSGFEDITMADGHQSIQFVVDEQNKLWPWRAGVRINVEIEDAQAIEADADAAEQNAPVTTEDQEAAE